MKVLFVTSEAVPFIKTGGLGDVAGALPPAINKLDKIEIAVVLPYYKKIKEKYGEFCELIGSFTVSLSWRSEYCGVFKYKYDDNENHLKNKDVHRNIHHVTFYFIDNEKYFLRDDAYGYYDDGERFAFFSKAVIEMQEYIGYHPDVMHLNDWQTALVPAFLKGHYGHLHECKRVKTIFTIHNVEYQGQFPDSFFGDVTGLPGWIKGNLQYGDCINLMAGAIRLSDKVTTVSETYAEELKTSFFAHGMENLIREFSYKMTGILNGIDMDAYDPRKDEVLLPNRFSDKRQLAKSKVKMSLQDKLGLPVDADVALVSMVTRLVSHKGIDLLNYIFDELMSRHIQLVMLGTGDHDAENKYRGFADKYQKKFSANIMFDEELAKLIFAASDFFLMPSKTEPCGLSQMIAMRYGTVPIVNETGGLKDTVSPVNPETGEGRGFTFKSYNAHDMLNAVDRALTLFYDDKKMLRTIRANIMTVDFSWYDSAKKYTMLYKEIVK